MHDKARIIIAELEARKDGLSIRAAQLIRELTKDKPKYKDVGSLRVFLENRNPEVNGVPIIDITNKELKLLQFLAKSPRYYYGPEILYEAIYEEETEHVFNTLYAAISRLRTKLKAYNCDYIDCKSKLGWALIEPEKVR